MPRLPAALLGLLRRAGAVLVLQHFLILLQKILRHVEHGASSAGVAATPPLVLRLVLGVAVLVAAALGVVPLVECARPAGPLEQAVPPGLQVLQDAVPAGLGLSQDRRVLALLASRAEDPRQRRLLLHHRRDGVGRRVLGGRVTVLRLVADVHLGCFHANRDGYVVRVRRSAHSRCAARIASS